MESEEARVSSHPDPIIRLGDRLSFRRRFPIYLPNSQKGRLVVRKSKGRDSHCPPAAVGGPAAAGVTARPETRKMLPPAYHGSGAVRGL